METSIHASDTEGAPSEIQIIPFGRHQTDKGTFVLDEAGMSEIISEFEGRKNDMVIDYEHQTLGGAEAPAAGWIKRLMNRGANGLWACVEWTSRAKTYLGGREYRYLSPVFLKTETGDRVVQLINAALTNQPAIDGMVPVINSRSAMGNPKKEGGQKMDKILLEALGIEDTADSMERALTAIGAMRATLEGVREELGIGADAASSELLGTLVAMRQSHDQISGLAGRVYELEALLTGREADELVTLAMREGKLTPAQKDWARQYAESDPEGFRVFAAKAARLVPLSDIPAGPAKLAHGIDEIQNRVNEYMGITAHAFSKYVK